MLLLFAHLTMLSGTYLLASPALQFGPSQRFLDGPWQNAVRAACADFATSAVAKCHGVSFERRGGRTVVVVQSTNKHWFAIAERIRIKSNANANPQFDIAWLDSATTNTTKR